jgi:hypothetical protein
MEQMDHVGPKPSIAPLRVSDVDAARALLEEIAGARRNGSRHRAATSDNRVL